MSAEAWALPVVLRALEEEPVPDDPAPRPARVCSLTNRVHVACSHSNPPKKRRGMCQRDLHDLTDDRHRTPEGRCRPCKLEYNRRRNDGTLYNDAGHRLSRTERDYLRSLIPCMGCGRVPRERKDGIVFTKHRTGCAVARIREGGE